MQTRAFSFFKVVSFLSSLDQAVQLLKNHDVVAIPTETVYGLAASIYSDSGIEKIFKTKERPFFDPLIVHVSSIEQAKSLVQHWPEAALMLAHEFWPGPLTLVLEKNAKVSDVITSGLTTVGLRMPQHSLTLELIEKVGPLAAPSANKFGKTSPTQAIHVEQEFAREKVFVLDGGPCDVGIESTILLIKNNRPPHSLSLLRPGHVSEKQIEQVLNRHQISFEWISQTKKIEAPGQMKHHYMPKLPLIIVDEIVQLDTSFFQKVTLQIQQGPSEVEGVQIEKPKDQIQNFELLQLSEDPVLAARNLYSELRRAAEQKKDCLLFIRRAYHQELHWKAFFDRLNKAATVIIEA